MDISEFEVRYKEDLAALLEWLSLHLRLERKDKYESRWLVNEAKIKFELPE
jgi:hypothetical protein